MKGEKAMRKTILGFKQEKLVEAGLSLNEALILKHIEDFMNSGKTETLYDEKDKTMYHWIYYDKILKDLPILNITSDTLSRIIRFNLAVEPAGYKESFKNFTKGNKDKRKYRKYLGFIKNKTVKNSIFGSRTYLALTPKFYDLKEDLFDDTDKEKSPSLDREKSPSPQRENSPCLDREKSPSLDRENSPDQRYINNYIYIIGHLNKSTGKNFKASSSKTRSLIDARLKEGYTLEDFYKVIDTKTLEWKGTNFEKYLRPETLFGLKFEGYLNESITTPVEEKKKAGGMTGYQDM